MKETYYFSHDYNASQDPKILNMISELGWEGYGLYWLLVEKLAEANGKLSLNDLKGLAFAWKIDATILKSLTNDFQLFNTNEQVFWSNRLLQHLKQRQKSSNIRSKAGRIGGLASAKQRSSNRQVIVNDFQAKESKVKESKVNTISNDIAYGNENINWLLKEFEDIMKFKSTGTKDRFMAKHLLNSFNCEQLTAMLTYCSTNKYAPRIGSVEKMWYKRGDIIAGIKSTTNKSNNLTIIG